MREEKLQYYKERLIKEKKQILKSINHRLKEKYGSMDMYYSELSGFGNHPGDIGTEVFIMEQDKGLKNKLDDILKEIEDSLEDIENENYGICKICNKYIDEERLQLIPYLKTCIDCSNEGKLPKDFRQFETVDEKKMVSFSMEPRENIGFDREDAYQKAALFNMVSKDPSFSTGDNMGIMDEEELDVVEDVEKISQEYYDETLK